MISISLCMEMLKNAESIWKRAVMALASEVCIQAEGLGYG